MFGTGKTGEDESSSSRSSNYWNDADGPVITTLKMRFVLGVASEVLDTTSTAILRMNPYVYRPQQGISTFPLRSSPIVAFRVMWETSIAQYAWLSTKNAFQSGKELSGVWRYKTWAIRHYRAAD